MIAAFANWLHATPLGWAASGGWPWLEPACKTLHFFGLVLVIGGVGAFDLRMLGLARQFPPGALRRLTPMALVGFVINLATGVVFFAGNPEQYLDNVAFWLKMLFIVLAGGNALAYYLGGVRGTVEALGAGASTPASAKILAATSLFLWLGVMYWGRMLAFIGNAF